MADVSHILAEIISIQESDSTIDKKFTTYVIRVHTKVTDWLVYRRFSKFYDLHIQLEHKFKHSLDLPSIRKKFHQDHFSHEFLEERKIQLQTYLDGILSRPVEVSLSEEVCLFLEVPEALRLRFLGLDPAPVPLALPNEPAVSHEELFQKDMPALWVPQFLQRLHDAPNSKANTIRFFKMCILTDIPRWTEEQIRLLYLGTDGNGLLREVGAFDHSTVSAMAALNLVRTLLSSQYYVDAVLHSAVLQTCHLNDLRRMRLDLHICHVNHGRDNLRDAFNILHSLDLPLESIQILLNEEDAMAQYRRWLDEVTYVTNELHSIHLSCETSAAIYVPGVTGRVPMGASMRPRVRMADDVHDASRHKEYAVLEEEIICVLRSCFNDIISSCTPHTGELSNHSNEVLRGGWRAAPVPEELVDVDVQLEYRKFAGNTDFLWRTFGSHTAKNARPSEKWNIRMKLHLPDVSCLAVVSLLQDHYSFLRAALSEKNATLPRESIDFLMKIQQGTLFPNIQSTSVHKVGGVESCYSEIVEVKARNEVAQPCTTWTTKVLKVVRTSVAPWNNGHMIAMASLPTGAVSHDDQYFLPSGILVAPARSSRSPASADFSPTADFNAEDGDDKASDRKDRSLIARSSQTMSALERNAETEHTSVSPELSFPQISHATDPNEQNLEVEPTDGTRLEESTGCEVLLVGNLDNRALGFISGDLLGDIGCFWSGLIQFVTIFKKLGPLSKNFDPVALQSVS